MFSPSEMLNSLSGVGSRRRGIKDVWWRLPGKDGQGLLLSGEKSARSMWATLGAVHRNRK